MSRYPFRHYYMEYLTDRRHDIAKSYYVELERRLRRISRELEQLYADGEISTIDPSRMTRDDARAFYVYAKSKNLSPVSIRHDLRSLDAVCQYCGNVCVQTARMHFSSLKGFRQRKRLPTIPYNVIKRILDEGVKKTGFWDIRRYAAVGMSFLAGLRTMEIQHAMRDNIDTERWEIYVDVVKGRGTYGEARTAPIHPDGWPLIKKYLEIRDREAKDSVWLFPSITHNDALSTNTFREYKRSVCRELGIELDFRAGRRTYGQWLIDDGVPAETVSIHMGHTTSKTTENYYARMRESDALRNTRKTWVEKGRIPREEVF